MSRAPRSRPRLRSRLRPILLLLAAGTALAAPALAADGPDVSVLEIPDIANYGSSGGIRAYAVGFSACNTGTAPVAWCDEPGGCGSGLGDEDHPVMAQGLYRVKDGRFEQIGMSWLKHGVNAINGSAAACGTCVEPPVLFHQLGVGCTDVYFAGANGARPLGMRSEVEPTSVAFPFPVTDVPATQVYDQRLKVLEADVDADLNPGAAYCVEAQLGASDDAAAGNGLDNAGYRQVTPATASPYDLTPTGATVRFASALRFWQQVDPAVEIVEVDFDTGPAGTVERFEVARKVTGGGSAWHYEYAVRNMNSKRAAQRFEIRFPGGATISNVGFHDVEHHSGEPYSTDDWDVDTGPGTVSWASAPPEVDSDANALRWATAFSFWFDSTQGPGGAQHTLELFTAGCPASLKFTVPGGYLFSDDFECGSESAWSLLVD
jgi:hypothetical protein